MTGREVREAAIGAFFGIIAAIIIVSVVVKVYDHFAPPSPYFTKDHR